MLTAKTQQKRVLLVANYLPDRQHSMQRYAALLYQGLKSHGMSVSMIRPPVIAGRLRMLFAGRSMGYVDKFFFFPFILRAITARCLRGDVGLVHLLDQGNGVYLQALSGSVRHLVTCHDLIALKAGTARSMPVLSGGCARKESFYQKMNLRALQKAESYACVSQATREECLNVLNIPQERCEVIYNPLDPFFLQAADPLPENFPLRSLVHVGNASWYKNRAGLLRIYAEMRKLGFPSPLVLMGEATTGEEKSLMKQLGIESHVSVIVQPLDATIRAAYAHADGLIFPSLEEGFGWPVLEAQAQGCPVFTTNRRPMTEAGGPTACYIEPEDAPGAAAVIVNELAKGLRDAAAVAARKAHAASFTTEHFITGYLNLYEKLMSSKTSA